MLMTKIDTHHHFWRYSPEEYPWIRDNMQVLRRDFGPGDLETEINSAGVAGVVSVQAHQSLDETKSLLDSAGRHGFIRGVVGWVPFVSDSVRQDIERFAGDPWLKGMRHIVHDEPDDDYLLRDDFNRGINVLKEFGLVYDVLIFERHLPQTLEFADRHPDQVFVLDHIAKPRIRENVLEPWRTFITQLAERPNVYCKVSGMVTEADSKTWTPEQFIPYLDTVFDAFGPSRLMFGSDWPVCLVAAGYRQWVEIVSDYTARLSLTEQGQFWTGTARRAYRLE